MVWIIEVLTGGPVTRKHLLGAAAMARGEFDRSWLQCDSAHCTRCHLHILNPYIYKYFNSYGLKKKLFTYF